MDLNFTFFLRLRNMVSQSKGLILAVICGIIALSKGCPLGWVSFSTNCYYFSEHSTTWSDASAFCKTFGGNLAMPKTPEENEFLGKEMDHHSNLANVNEYFIGAGDFFAEGIYQWIDFETIQHAPWGPHEPNNAKPYEDCVTIETNGVWNDDGCDMKLPFICQIEDFSLPSVG